jgi:aquaporin Z
MEAGKLGLFTFFACIWLTLFRHPASPVEQLVPDEFSRRALSGLGLGVTAIAIGLSPWGKQSGGHFNPAITLTFYRLGKVKPWDAVFCA